MKIGLLAMSGLRAHDPELIKLGLTLPGVIERGRVVTSMPCLGLLILAAVTPDEHELAYFEAEHANDLSSGLFRCDLIAMSALTAQAFEAYQVAATLRNRGIVVVLGGLHASVCPDEAAEHVDYVVVGEGEQVWPELLKQIPLRSPKKIWRASEFPPVSLTHSPLPRYDLLKNGNWNRFPVQTTRGCPWRCDFCASSIMLGRPYRKRPVEEIIRDIRFIKSLCGPVNSQAKAYERAEQSTGHSPFIKQRPFIELADDNTFVDHRWGRKLCEALIEEPIKWFTETDISVADDAKLLKLLRQSRCRQLLIGLESTTASELVGVELNSNFKYRRAHDYMDAVRRIQAEGVTVNGCFVLGLDHQGPDIFERIFDFAMSVPLYEVQVTVMTPFPGTPLYQRLLDEDRIIEPGRWDLCTLFDVNYYPAKMSVAELKNGLYWLVKRLYSSENIWARRSAFFKNLSG
ncbi:MAG TPA: radical SAM protein [Pirellulaceae bacterium]|nr:radical SAM protein [Pirellulaceae bacterium]HMO91383.1 radical SAM protein [Pirellulaceae bacterium]HMP69608.1 radical SAM protein [Pirellulaceae bacterium]